MHADIWIVRNGSDYFLLHGHMRLHSTLNVAGAAFVEVAHEGVVKITRVSGCLQVDSGNAQSPLCVQGATVKALCEKLPGTW
ncbi:hypothetical protein SAMN05880566_1308 [Janthinobacterium sp. TND4EL3]|uniref:hypothetical protein n=1 Tax=Janthinobacterium sp. TND4EL3 TaxID=1907311 RepID=UPI0009540EE5|nr:hypothetical protein [Janthinobacterium sp. TND4EL3]SIR86657.1 hypothetical protein SAMN05880566_1308 [Janthinobacterium sp. TND4EL3]